METYYRTWNGGCTTHLGGIADYTLCGMDVVGDEELHDREPERLPGGRRYRVTCPECKMLIGIVRGHLKSNSPVHVREE